MEWGSAAVTMVATGLLALISTCTMATLVIKEPYPTLGDATYHPGRPSSVQITSPYFWVRSPVGRIARTFSTGSAAAPAPIYSDDPARCLTVLLVSWTLTAREPARTKATGAPPAEAG